MKKCRKKPFLKKKINCKRAARFCSQNFFPYTLLQKKKKKYTLDICSRLQSRMLCHRRRWESTSIHCRKNWFGCRREWEQFLSSSCWDRIWRTRGSGRPGVCSWRCAQFDCHLSIKAIRDWSDACIQLEHNHRSIFHRDCWLNWCAVQSTQYRRRKQ